MAIVYWYVRIITYQEKLGNYNALDLIIVSTKL